MRYVAQHRCNNADNGISHSLVDHRQAEREQLDEQVSHKNKRSRGKRIAEQLYPAMQVRLRKHNVARQYKPCWETDSKSYDPCGHLCGDGQAAKNRNRMAMKKMVESKRIDNDVEYGVKAPTGKVPESLGRYDTSKRPVAKIYKPNYYMSDPIVHLKI